MTQSQPLTTDDERVIAEQITAERMLLHAAVRGGKQIELHARQLEGVIQQCLHAMNRAANLSAIHKPEAREGFYKIVREHLGRCASQKIDDMPWPDLDNYPIPELTK